MKEFLVDVPVQTNIWIRKECQKRQFEVIKEARPSTLFIVSDGGRNDKEWEIIRENRKMVEEGIDWDCTVYKIYEESNLGLYAMGEKALEYIWGIVDRCIFMEDDIIPDVTFFRFCYEMLEKYKNDTRIYAICGLNQTGINEACNRDYFFSRYGSIWGYACWKRSYEQHKSFTFPNDEYEQSLLKGITKKHPTHWKQFDSISKCGYYDNHVPGGEFHMNQAVYEYNQVFIIPKRNMICEMGYGSDSEHSDSLKRLPKKIRQLSNMKTYSMPFPINCPEYVIPDTEYEKQRNLIMGLDHPFVNLYRRIIRGFLVLKDGDLKYFLNKIRKRKWET